MSEYMLVETPAIFPQCCIVCQSGKGPLVDFVRENGGNRLYLCQMCLKRAARAMGLVKGDRMESLMKSGELLDEAERSAVEREALIEKQIAELAARARRIEALNELLQQEQNDKRTQRAMLESINEQSRQLLTVGS